MARIRLTRGERLKDLRVNKDLTHKQLSDAVGISSSALSEYERELKEPSVENLRRLAVYFEVSLDYLAGLSDCESSDIDIRAMSDRTNLTCKAITRLEWLKKNRSDDVDFDLIDLVNYLAESSGSDIPMSVNVLAKIPKEGNRIGMEDLETLEILERYYLGNLYRKIVRLVDKVRDDRESDERRREAMRVFRDKAIKQMKEVVAKGCETA